MPQFPGRPYHSSRTVTVLDLVCLLGNAYRGEAHPDVGFEDATQNIHTLAAKLNVKVRVSQSDVESCLWACNLLHERGKFWHPKGLTFDEFIRKLLPDAAFNKEFNLITEK